MSNTIAMTIRDRFWNKVALGTGDMCWIWLASKKRKGYGQFRRDGKMQHAPRVAYELAVGPIPSGMHVLHTCDNRACVNPSHLFIGTNADNVQDKVRKGRQARNCGSSNGRAKLTSGDVREIRRRAAAKEGTQRDIAKEFGVSWQLVSFIVTRRRWKNE